MSGAIIETAWSSSKKRSNPNQIRWLPQFCRSFFFLIAVHESNTESPVGESLATKIRKYGALKRRGFRHALLRGSWWQNMMTVTREWSN